MYEIYVRRPSNNPGKPYLLAGFENKNETQNYLDYLKGRYPHSKFIVKEHLIPEKRARAFWKDLMGTLGYDTKSTHGIMSTEMIAERMDIEEPRAEMFLRGCVEYKITERQGGGWVV